MAKRLYTLSTVAEKTDISMNTLLRYKKQYQSRIPSVGEGRKQRYPKEAFAVFSQIKRENLAKRGRRPRGQKRSKPKGQTRLSTASAGADVLTLRKVAELSQISYGTAARYAKIHASRIPSVGKGRKRRYPRESIAVFKAIRSGSRPGRKPGANKPSLSKVPSGPASDVSNTALARRIDRLERTLAGVSRQLEQIARDVNRPLKVTIGA
jgi:DNA-binding transcriptional MerR regulator